MSSLPTFVAVGTYTHGTGAIAPPFPAGVQLDDVALLFVESANQPVSAPSGWTSVGTAPATGTAAAAAATCLQAFWKACAGTESSTTVSVADAGDHTSAQIAVFRGVDKTSPIHVSATSVTTPTSTSCVCPTATTTIANCLVVLAASVDTDIATARFGAYTNAALGSITERADSATTDGGGGGLGIATGTKATTGAIGTSTCTLTSTGIQAHWTIALKPQTAFRVVVAPAAFSWTGVAVADFGIVPVKQYSAQLTACPTGTTSSFSSVPFGAADTERDVWVFVTAVSHPSFALVPPTVASMTIAGVDAIEVAASLVTGQSANGEWWYARVPSGTSGTVAITWSSVFPDFSGSKLGGAAIVVYTTVGADAGGPIDAGTVSNGADTGGTITTDIDPHNCSLAACLSVPESAISWTGATEDTPDAEAVVWFITSDIGAGVLYSTAHVLGTGSTSYSTDTGTHLSYVTPANKGFKRARFQLTGNDVVFAYMHQGVNTHLIEGIGALDSANFVDTSEEADGTEWTYTDAPLDSAAADRIIFFMQITSAEAAASVTIGGVAATLVKSQLFTSASGDVVLAVWQALVPTGSTGDIVTTFTAAGHALSQLYFIYYCIGADTTTPVGVALSTTADDDTIEISTLDVDPQGGAIAFYSCDVGAAVAQPSVMSGLSGDTPVPLTSGAFVAGQMQSGNGYFVSGITNVDITVLDPEASNLKALIVFSITPASTGVSMSVGTASFIETGQAVAFSRTRRLSAGVAAFSLAGQAVSYSHQSRIKPVSATFLLTGNDIVMQAGQTLGANPGNFALVGQVVRMIHPKQPLAVETASFAESGQSVTLSYRKTVAAVTASFAFTGKAISLRRTRIIPAATAGFVATGKAVLFARTREVRVLTASFLLSGQATHQAYNLKASPPGQDWEFLSNESGTSTTFSISAKRKTPGRLAVIGFSWISSGASIPTVITVNGISQTILGLQTATGLSSRPGTCFVIAKVPDDTVLTIVSDIASTTSHNMAIWLVYDGYPLSPTVDLQSSNNGSSTTIDFTVDPDASGAIFAVGACIGLSGTPTFSKLTTRQLTTPLPTSFAGEGALIDGSSTTITATFADFLTHTHTATIIALKYRTYQMVPKDVNFRVSMPAAKAAFALTGQAVGFRATMPAARAVFVLSAKSVTYHTSMPVVRATFSLVGKTIIPRVGMPAAAASYTLTPKVVLFKLLMNIGTADFAFTGQVVSIHRVIPFAIETARFGFQASSVEFRVDADVHWREGRATSSDWGQGSGSTSSWSASARVVQNWDNDAAATSPWTEGDEDDTHWTEGMPR